MKGHHNLRPDNWGKIFTDLFTKYSDGYIRIQSVWIYRLLLPLIPAIHRMGNSPNTLWPWSREQDQSHPHFIFHWKLFKTILDFSRGLINLNYTLICLLKLAPNQKWRLHIPILWWGTFGDSPYSLKSVFQAFYKDKYDKIIELSYIKCSQRFLYQ